MYKSRRKPLLTTVKKKKKNVSMLREPNLILEGLPRSGKGYRGQMNQFFRICMDMLVEKLLKKRMKQMIDVITITLFPTQALSCISVNGVCNLHFAGIQERLRIIYKI